MSLFDLQRRRTHSTNAAEGQCKVREGNPFFDCLIGAWRAISPSVYLVLVVLVAHGVASKSSCEAPMVRAVRGIFGSAAVERYRRDVAQPVSFVTSRISVGCLESPVRGRTDEIGCFQASDSLESCR